MLPRFYKRVETIDRVVATDMVAVTDDTVERVGKSESNASSYKVQWFNSDDEELPESSAIYVFLEKEFHKLPEDER